MTKYATHFDLGQVIASVFATPKPQLTIPDHIIYESERWVVTASNIAPHSFEIVNCVTKTEVYLHGASADYFQSCIRSWQVVTPDQDQVEATLASLEWCIPLQVELAH